MSGISTRSTTSTNPPVVGLQPGSRPIAADGSVALVVLTRRALSWQILDTNDVPVVRERYWLTLQPGEIRTCDGCHGVNTLSHDAQLAATNPPQALADLLGFWKQETGILFDDGFEGDEPSSAEKLVSSLLRSARTGSRVVNCCGNVGAVVTKGRVSERAAGL